MRNGAGVRGVIMAAALGALASPAVARAAERTRIVMLGVRGDDGAAVASQLSQALCGARVCVPPDRVRRAGKLDFAAAKAQGVAGMLFGTVARQRLQLALLVGSLSPQKTWSLPLERGGKLSAASVEGVSRDLDALLGAAAAPAPAAEARQAPRPVEAEAARPAAPTAGAESAPERVPAAVSAPPRAPPRPAAPESPVAAPTVTPVRRAAVDVGVDFSQRKLSYSGTSTGSSTLLAYDASAIVSPVVRLEVSPLATSEGRWYSGATIFASGSRSFGLETEDATTAHKRHGTTLTKLEGGAGLRLRPSASWRGELLPRVSYRTVTLKVSGGGIAGLPDTDLAGPSVGVDLEAPLAGRFGVLAGASYTAWLQAKQLVKGYFPSGSAYGLDGNVGVSARVSGPFSLRASLDYTRTTYSLSGTSAYRASGATDTYLTVRAVARASF